jgi:diguanylate cyclase (GGDEF)-like protein
MLAIGATGLLVVIGYGLEAVPRPVQAAGCWGVLTVVHALEVRISLRIAALPTTSRAGARFWRLVAAAAAMFCAGSVVQAGYSAARPMSPLAIVGTPPHVALLTVGAVFLILSMLTSPLGLTGKRERIRFWLDAATVMVGVALFAWQLSGLADAGAGAGSAAAPDNDELISALLGPAAFVVVAFGLVKITMGGTTIFTPVAGALGCVAAVLESVNTALAQQLLSVGRTGWVLGLGLLANVAFVGGLRAQYLESRGAAAAARGRRTSTHSRLPYVAVAASYGLLIWVLLDQSLTARAWVVLAGAIVSSGLVVARQLAAFADNDDLLGRLNTKVGELAEARDVLQRALGERDMLAERLRHLAYHDSLTGLANRALFLERLTAALATGDEPTVMIIDLDDFKPVNDAHGHHAGDTLLRAVADRLAGCVGSAGTVARLGGDEFAILLPQGGPADVAELTRRVSATVARPVSLGGASEVLVRASVGAATATAARATDPAVALTELLHRADLAMYAAKQGKPAARV